MAKMKAQFQITKTNEKQSAYLVIGEIDLPTPARDSQGRIVMDLETLLGGQPVSAWTTLATAKREAAKSVGRNRLPWIESTNESTSVWTATNVDVPRPK